MFARKYVECFLVVASLWCLRAAADSCVVMETCILPCTFTPGDELVLHWIQVLAGNTYVHSFYHSKDQLGNQDRRFSGRTSLFLDQIPRGNASLRLYRVQVQDEGRYKCYSSTITGNEESFQELIVEAPVRAVVLQQLENRIRCSSEGIYPQPELTWSTKPPSTVTDPQEKPTVQKTQDQLYSISSSIARSNRTDVVYSCTVSARGKGRRTTLFTTGEVKYSLGKNTTITCRTLTSPVTRLTWRFNRIQEILTRVGTKDRPTVSDGWRERVEEVSESGSLTLTHLSAAQEGTYTCEVSDARETYVTDTNLRAETETTTAGLSTAAIVGVVVGVVALVALVCGVVYFKRKQNNRGNKTRTVVVNGPDSENTPNGTREEMEEMVSELRK